MVIIPQTTKNVADTLSATHALEKKQRRQILLKIIEVVLFLGRQGIALRGHNETESNFMQLLQLRGKDDPRIFEWLKKKDNKYTSPVIQNELLQLMSLQIIRDISGSIHEAKFYTIMIDECTDISNHEQLVVCLRWVDENLEVHEDFIGLYQIPNTFANTLVASIKDCLLRLNLNINSCRGQCYDGAAAMAGSKNGVATQILSIEPRALFTHCYGHSLNLAVCDSIKHCKIIEDAMDVVHEITKLIKFSPKRGAIFDNLKEELSPDTPGFRVLCPTRWTVRANSLQSVLDNYAALQSTWETTLESKLDTEMKSRVLGVRAQMETFDFFYGVYLGKLVLKHADNLSKTLQGGTISAAEGQRVAELTVSALEKIRNDREFDLFWRLLQIESSLLDICEPQLPRRRKIPMRYQIGSSEHHHADTIEEYYRRYYYEVLDYTINSIRNRFNQPGYRTYKHIENLLLKAANGKSFDDDFDEVISFYGDDFNSSTLRVQLETLSSQGEHSTIKDIVMYIRGFSSSERQIFSEVVTLVNLVLVNPATNAISERSFSAMKRIKTYLRSTMSQERLNAIMVLHVHKQRSDKLVLLDIGNQFVNKEHRQLFFGEFV